MSIISKHEAAKFYELNYEYSEPLFSWKGNRLYLGSKSERDLPILRYE